MDNRQGTVVAPCDLVGFRLILNTHVNPYVDGTSHQLLVPPFRLSTVGRRTFPVAASIPPLQLIAIGHPVIPVSARLPPTS